MEASRAVSGTSAALVCSWNFPFGRAVPPGMPTIMFHVEPSPHYCDANFDAPMYGAGIATRVIAALHPQ